MCWYKKLFRNNKQSQPPPIPLWNEIVEMMYDKDLDSFEDEVVQVIYSKSKSMRYVILRDENNLLTYQLEEIYPFNQDEYYYISANKKELFAMWEPVGNIKSKSIFANKEDLLKEIMSTPEYKQHFL